MSTAQEKPTIGDSREYSAVSRRDFLEFCTKLMAAAPVGLALTETAMAAEDVAEQVEAAKRPSVVWLHFQDCTGCSESLLRTSEPTLATLITELISLDYHETLMAASGYQAEQCLHEAVEENEGKFVCVVEGSIPMKQDGIYMTVANRTAVNVLKEVGSKAAAIVAIGSCAAWGGIPSSGPNPTGAVGVDAIIKDVPIVNIPGCPPNPYVVLGTVLQYATAGTLPALDDKKRPKFAFDRNIHEHCPRRAHFDAGRFAKEFGDEGHRNGWCLYELGCKGPETHAACSTRHFNNTPGVWPIGIGAPCVGCTEEKIAFKKPMFQTAEILRPTPPDTYAPVDSPRGRVDPVATGVVGLAAGAVLGGTYVAAQRFKAKEGDQLPDEKDES